MAKENLKKLKQRLAAILKKEALKKGRFLLSSGKTSNYYLDGRIITLTPQGAYLVARILLKLIKIKKIDAIGGPTLGADPIVGAIACLSHIHKIPVKTFIVRKAAKGHGTKRQIEGPHLKKNDRVVLVDDIATTGGSLIEAKKLLNKRGVSVKCAYVVVDREEGAEKNLKRFKLRLVSIFKIRDLGV
jgi:orotate phosphoribosyltransferase